MDDNDVCPLCCEELDMSDRQFFPCKCGYQVCMWCWHRIRESESGLCPACRTPYGDDPHEFSAVDMEEVVKANKEKAAAEKRERERLRQQQAAAASSSSGSLGYGSGGSGAGSGALSNLGNMHIGGGSDGDLAVAMGSGSIGRGQLEPPKDRNQLANMRVIRRNLVYAVGLPPSIATEELLRKSEYFGQYGKISKIVINRNHNGNGDPRRASASAYVTFAHKEDTLACILALDGFYLDGRNIRASYGTSKYCSAFIKNVRCNNPDCTYLHCMGDSEDTFTKQEIQAGYVTSGRDVLARQQQQMVTTSGSGSSRRRVGGGGPSGTGKVPPNPVFPSPSFDEQPKSSTSMNLVGTPSPVPGSNPSVSRSLSSVSAAGFSSAASGVPTAASVAAGKVSRSVSMGAPSVGGVGSAPSASSVVAVSGQSTGTKIGMKTSKGFSVSGVPVHATGSGPGPVPATAASVVAGLASASSSSSTAVQPPAHTTLTPLGSLKRGSSLPVSVKNSSVAAGGSSKSAAGGGLGSASSFSAANSSSGNDAGVESVHLPANANKGLPPAEQASLTRQQRDVVTKLSALKTGSGTASGGGGQQQSGSSSSASTPSLSSVSGPAVPALKQATPGKESFSSSGVIGGTVISSNTASAGKPGAGPIGSVVGQGAPFPGLGGLGAVGSDSAVSSGILIGGANSSSLEFGAIGSASSAGGSSLLGGQEIVGGMRSMGGAVKDGQGSNIGGSVLTPQTNSTDKWGKPPGSQDNGFLGGGSSFGISGGGIWGNEGSTHSTGPAPIGNQGSASVIQSGNAVGSGARGGEIGSGRVVGQLSSSAVGSAVGGSNLFGNNSFAGSSGHNTGSSALASMLGIELPTGSGSLREASSFWGSSPDQPPVGSLGNSGVPPGPIGAGVKPCGGLVIGQRTAPSGSGGIPIGGYGANSSGGSTATIGSNNNDIALLQSLLPGVRITSGNAHQPAAPISSGRGAVLGGARLGPATVVPPAPPQHQLQRGAGPVGVGIGGINIQQQHQGNSDTWGGAGLYPTSSGAPNPANAQQQQQRQTSIW